MLTIVSSQSGRKSECFKQSKRRKGETNLAWLERHMEPLEAMPSSRGLTYVALFGGKEEADFRLRVAQGHIRHDMSPSHWSHVALLRGSGWTRSHATWEISLEPRKGFIYPPRDNGVQQSSLSNYGSSNKFPNLALIRVPVKLSAVRSALRSFKMQRNSLDAVELILAWLAYVWGVGRSPNPLLDGMGLPSAAMIETLVGAAGFDLTPGLESHASCPEAIWQAATWWHEYYGAGEGDSGPDLRLHGYWHTEHFLG